MMARHMKLKDVIYDELGRVWRKQ